MGGHLSRKRNGKCRCTHTHTHTSCWYGRTFSGVLGRIRLLFDVVVEDGSVVTWREKMNR
jgi:hypothetical protein